MKYNILAKFVIPVEQSDVVLRDSIYSGIQYAGCYLLSNVSDERYDWYRKNPDKAPGYVNRPCRYAVALEDWGNVFLKDTATVVTEEELDLDPSDYYDTYTHALLGFQYVVNELLMEMNAAEVQRITQEIC